MGIASLFIQGQLLIILILMIPSPQFFIHLFLPIHNNLSFGLIDSHSFLAVLIQCHSLENLNHLNYLMIAVLLLLSHLLLPQQLVSQQIYDDLLLDVGPPPQEIFLRRHWFLRWRATFWT